MGVIWENIKNYGNYHDPKVVIDYVGGIIATWEDPTNNIYAQRRDSNGFVYSGWVSNGSELSSGPTDNMAGASIVSGNNAGEAFVTWGMIFPQAIRGYIFKNLAAQMLLPSVH